MDDNLNKLFNGPSSEAEEPDPRDTGNYKSPIDSNERDTFDSKVPDEYQIISRIYADIFSISSLGRGQILRMILCDLEPSELNFFIVFINSLVKKSNGEEFNKPENEERFKNAINHLQHIDTVHDRVVATLALMKTPSTIMVPKDSVPEVIRMLTSSHGLEVVEEALEQNKEEEGVKDKVEV